MKTLTIDQTNSAIDAMGGTSRVASICDLTPGAVSQWRKNGIPKGFLLFLRNSHPSAFDFVDDGALGGMGKDDDV